MLMRWAKDGMMGHMGRDPAKVLVEPEGFLCRDTMTPEYRRHPPRSQLERVERGNPNGVWTDPVGQP